MVRKAIRTVTEAATGEPLVSPSLTLALAPALARFRVARLTPLLSLRLSLLTQAHLISSIAGFVEVQVESKANPNPKVSSAETRTKDRRIRIPRRAVSEARRM